MKAVACKGPNEVAVADAPDARIEVTGQAPVKRYNRELRDLILSGRAKPSVIVSHEPGLGDAPDAYRHFDKREDGWTKVVRDPTA